MEQVWASDFHLVVRLKPVRVIVYYTEFFLLPLWQCKCHCRRRFLLMHVCALALDNVHTGCVLQLIARSQSLARAGCARDKLWGLDLVKSHSLSCSSHSIWWTQVVRFHMCSCYPKWIGVEAVGWIKKRRSSIVFQKTTQTNKNIVAFALSVIAKSECLFLARRNELQISLLFTSSLCIYD